MGSQLGASGKDSPPLGIKREAQEGMYLSPLLPPVFLLWPSLYDDVLSAAVAAILQSLGGGSQRPWVAEQKEGKSLALG